MLCAKREPNVNWEAIGAAAELLSAIAVLATLVYLAVQVRHSRDLLEENRKIALSQVYQARADSRISILMQNIDEDLYAEVYGELENANASQSKVATVMSRDLVLCDNVLYQHSLGLIEEQDYRRISVVVQRSFSRWKAEGLVDPYPRIRQCYEANRGANA